MKSKIIAHLLLLGFLVGLAGPSIAGGKKVNGGGSVPCSIDPSQPKCKTGAAA